MFACPEESEEQCTILTEIMNKDEQDMFDHSVDSVKGLVEACKKIDPSLA